MANPPPKSVEPATLFQRLIETPRPTTKIKYPRRKFDERGKPTGDLIDVEVAIWVLTESELMRARASAEKFAKVQLDDPEIATSKHLGYEDIYRNACVVEVCCLAVRDPADTKLPMFANPDIARRYVTSDEWAALFEAYCLWQAESGPLVSDMDQATMDAWLKVLEEGASRLPLSRLSSGARDALLMHSVSRPLGSRAGSGSPGSPPGETTSDPSSPSPSASEKPSEPPPLGDDERAREPVKDE